MLSLRSLFHLACAVVVIATGAHAQNGNLSKSHAPGTASVQHIPDEVAQKNEASTEPRAAQTAVSLTDPVLTIRGVCTELTPASETDGRTCSTVVTRKEFEVLMDMVAPGSKGNAGARQSVAKTYAELLAFETAARKAGIPDTAEFRWTLALLRLRALADSYRRNLEKQYATPSNEEIDDYYRREVRRFEEVKLRRIVLPKNNFSAANKEEFEKKALQVANEVRQRAGNGEDFDVLQREGYAALGFPGSPPATEVGSRRRASLLSEIADEVFGLNPGQVSRVENEPYSFVIYKVEAKRTIPEQMVRDEISREISRQKMDNAVKAVTGAVHADLNEEYFGKPAGQPQSAEPPAKSPQ